MNSMDTFLNSVTPLTPCDAVAALIVLDDGRYLLQLRDDKPEIFFPGHWGLFGGAMEAGEGELAALYRELEEELNLTHVTARRFATLGFDLTPIGCNKVIRAVYEVRVSEAQLKSLTLNEGAAFAAWTGREIFSSLKVTPYDSFALWLHSARDRLKAGG